MNIMHRCPICNGQSFTPLPRAAYYVSKPAGLLLYRCKGCGTVSAPDYNHRYDADYYDGYDENHPGTPPYEARHQVFRERVEFFSKATGGGRILDIGCANGDFLDHAARYGFTTFGVEISSNGAREATRRGHRVVNTSAVNLPFASASFDAIHMNHVLEHVDQPLNSLRDIHRILKPNGFAIIEVPNEIGPLAIRLKLIAGHLGVPGTPRDRYAPHIIYFDMRTFSAALDQAGLKVIRRFYRFAGSITPSLATVPAVIARAYDRITCNGDQIGVVVTPR